MSLAFSLLMSLLYLNVATKNWELPQATVTSHDIGHSGTCRLECVAVWLAHDHCNTDNATDVLAWALLSPLIWGHSARHRLLPVTA